MAALPPSPQVTILAFDFGTHKIGMAVGQSLTQTSTPLPELTARDGKPDWHKVETTIQQWQPDAFVVGVPIHMDGTEFELTQRAKKFGKRLHGRFGKPCFEMDERLSSFEARERARESKQKQALVDSVAASLILQSWFNHQWPLLLKEAKP